MILLFLLLLFHFHTIPSQSTNDEPELAEYEKTYTAYTNGSLIANRYRMIRDNDTRRFSVRVRFTTSPGRCYPTISLQCTRNTSMLTAVLPRTQTFSGSSSEYMHLQDTLCEMEKNNNTLDDYNGTVHLSISSAVPTRYSFSVHKCYHYSLEVSSPLTLLISPSEPEFFKFTFPKDVERIKVLVTSTNDVCGRLTILKANCPVFDNEGQVVLNDKYAYQTIARKGFLIVDKEHYGDKLHIVFSVLPNDDVCKTRPYYPELQNEERLKEYTVLITAGSKSAISIFSVLGLFVAFTISTILIMWFSKNWKNDVSQTYEEDSFWGMMMSHCCTFIPLALIIVVIKYPWDSDSCNINFMCAVEFIGLKAANNVLSAFSIAVVGIGNFILSWFNHWEQHFTINMCTIETGLLWAVMNTCPQSATFHLYSLAMIVLVLQAKFLLFSIRNGMKLWHQNYIGAYTVTTMMILIFDSMTNSIWAYYIGRLAIAINAFGFTSYFLRRYWIMLTPVVRISAIQSERAATAAADNLPLIRSIDDIVDSDPLPHSTEDPEITDSVSVTHSETSNARERIFINIFQHRTSLPTERSYQIGFTIISLVLVFTWTILVPVIWPHYSSTLVVLRLIQSDFLLYFLYYCANKFKYEAGFGKLKWFWISTAFFFIFIIFWAVISQYLLPAFVPYSPAESRNLNRECLLSDVTGTDWHDILHYCSAAICLLFPVMMKRIDLNLQQYQVVTRF